MKLNKFDKAIMKLAVEYAPEQVAEHGDIVIAHGNYWKRPHKVKITCVYIEIVGIGLTIKQREDIGITGWLTVQHKYVGRIVKKNGELLGNLNTGLGFVIDKFVTSEGKKYKRIPSDFNHAGLVFETVKRERANE